VIQSFFFYKTKKYNYIRVHLNFFKKNVFFKNVKLISKYNHFFFISVTQLKLLASYIGISSLIIETVKGPINNKNALKKNIGGRLAFIFF
jgi:ribosomal protein S8